MYFKVAGALFFLSILRKLARIASVEVTIRFK
jgi:hypothetical protein